MLSTAAATPATETDETRIQTIQAYAGAAYKKVIYSLSMQDVPGYWTVLDMTRNVGQCPT